MPARFGTITQDGNADITHTTHTLTHTFESGGQGNVLLVVGTINWFGQNTAGVTWDGVAMSLAIQNPRGDWANAGLWYILNPTSTGLQTIVATMNTDVLGSCVVAANYELVDSSPIGTTEQAFFGTNVTSIFDSMITTKNNSLIVICMASARSDPALTYTPKGAEIKIWDVDTPLITSSAPGGAGGFLDAPTAGTFNYGFDETQVPPPTGHRAGIAAFELLGLPAPPAPPPAPVLLRPQGARAGMS